ncbi:MAG: 16S rRNA (cytosine(1402)-N(4))-methyltransferase RsmH [Gammaproteobacteria bacterium]|nr:16S rRNA (cytosine(1402)-N(4))-methyltransferase RsmH [Gammaproteobacteria bacterium]MDH3428748.1 16S rRNA (cytosine(1402)-N(4))-methyltransferase RsmH [Gammaproteobacteria bacterium]
MSSNEHVPVLLGPVLKGLNVRKDGVYVDGTFGRGGHSSAILQQLNAHGRLIAIDRDPQAIAAAPPTLTNDPRFELIRCEIAELAKSIDERGLKGLVDGLLLDLGVSSPQLDKADRGFSFLRDGPLDMRMDPESGVSAADWLRAVDERSLKIVLRKFGEETQAARIARAIVASRRNGAIETTGQLANIISSVIPAHTRKKHPATRTFQAIRIFINKELEQLEAALAQSIDILAPGGRLCVISFHSLEDRIVKRFMRDASREAEQYRGMPDIPEAFRPKLRPIGKLITASADEINVNVRARSARLRIAERT